jgi:hypothetical protein
MKLYAVAGAVAVLLSLAGCGDANEVAPTDSAAPTPSVTPGETEVSWGQAKRLLRDCRVTLVSQAHSLEVLLILDDGTRARTKEPGIDDVLDLAFDAQQKCGGQPEQIATE